jgi:YbgC/YbaW family acyl-CoA thioester hydrolase
MPHQFKVTRQVEFAETDMAGIVHFSNFFKMMENTEHAFYRSLGFSVVAEGGDGSHVGWPRVHAECDYTYPLRFEDTVEVELLVRKKGEKTLTYDFHFRRVKPGPVQEVATGSLVVVAVSFDKRSGVMKSVPLPAGFREQIEAAPAAMLERKGE